MKLTTDYNREREAERIVRERKFQLQRELRDEHQPKLHRSESGSDSTSVDHSGEDSKEKILALATRELCPCVEMTKHLLEQQSRLSNNASTPTLSNIYLQGVEAKFHAYGEELKKFHSVNYTCRHGLLLSTLIVSDNARLLARLHSWKFISFKSLPSVDGGGRNPTASGGGSYQQNIFHWAVRRQAMRCLRELMHLFGEDELPAWLLDADARGVTPLHLAAGLPSGKVLKLLLKPLLAAAATHGIVAAQLDGGVGTSADNLLCGSTRKRSRLCDEDGRTPLHYAAEAGALVSVEQLLALADAWHMPVDQRDANGLTPLMYAVAAKGPEQQRDALVRLMVSKKPTSVAARCNKRGMSAVHIAVMANSLSALKILLELVAERGEIAMPKSSIVECLDNKQRTPLHYAALYGRAEGAELLLQHGASDETCDQYRVAPSHYAALGGDSATMLTIWRHMAALRPPSTPYMPPLDEERRTPFMWAVLCQREELVQAMLAARNSSPPTSREQSTSLHDTRRKTSATADLSFDKTHRDIHHYTALHLAALVGNVCICRALVEAGFSAQERDRFEATPEHLAAGEGHYDALLYFAYKRAASVPWQTPLDAMGRSPLAYACLGGQAYTLQVMLQAQPTSLDLRHVDSLRRSALHCAVMANSLACVEVLLASKRGLDAALSDLEGLTALDLAAKLGHKEIVTYLQSDFAKKDAKEMVL